MGSRTATLLAVTSVAATGCGGGRETSAPSRPVYIRQADAICKKGNDALQAADAKFFAGVSNPTAQQEAEYIAKVFVPNLEGQLAKLRKLNPPQGDEDAVRSIWDASAAGLAEIKAKHGPPETPPAGFKKASRLAAQYGFKVCGST